MTERNRIANTKNMYQGDARKVLCICSAGLLRSPTAANVLHREYGYNTRSAGSSNEYAMIPVTPPLLHWADEFVCMEPEHLQIIAEKLEEQYLVHKDIYCLQIPDSFAYMDKKLQELVVERYNSAADLS